MKNSYFQIDSQYNEWTSVIFRVFNIWLYSLQYDRRFTIELKGWVWTIFLNYGRIVISSLRNIFNNKENIFFLIFLNIIIMLNTELTHCTYIETIWMPTSAPFYQELPQRYQPKRMTIMEVSPRGKHGKKTSRGDSTQRSVGGSSISEFEDVLRTVEFQQSKIDQLTKRYWFNLFGL